MKDDFIDPVENVFGLAALAGHPLGDGSTHLWGSAGLLYFGGFEKDGVSVDGGVGYQFQLGLAFPGLFNRN